LKQLEHDIETAVADWPVPGLGCSVIRDGEVVLSRGFGLRTVGESTPVDEHTLFAIGSVSKSFTGAAVAMLVDEGLLTWESRVIDHLPDFRLFDPFVTRELTVRDLLTHRGGLERGDFMWYKSGYDVAAVMQRIRHLAPSWSFRSTFGYQNVMYVAAGELIRTLTGKSWDQFVDERLLTPLGMTHSSSSIAGVDRSGNLASPHVELEGKAIVIEPHEGDNMNPAGSIYSSARDMTRWLTLQLSDGAIDGERLLTSGSLGTTQTPQMLIANASPWLEMFPDAHFLSYGAGWFIWTYRGHKLISHGGNIDGMAAVACVIPEVRFGISALCNLDGTLLPQALLHHTVDAVLGDGKRAWLSEFQALQTAGKERLEFAQAQRTRERLTGTQPSRPLPEYAGTYVDPFYGNAAISRDDGGLAFAFVGWTGRLEHWQLDTFRLLPDSPILKKYQPEVRFELDDFGKPIEVTLIVLGAVRLKARRTPEAPPAIPLSPDELRAFEGTYVSAAPRMRVRIEMLAETLKASLPGALAGAAAEYAVVSLVPAGADRFSIPNTDIGIRFERAAGALNLLRLETPHQQPFEFLKH
jgi:CubicO group peptidase (beta-lactamase class C family)